MKYLLLAYDNENRLAVMPPGERAAYDAACLTSREGLRDSHLCVAARLEDSPLATAVQVRNGQVEVMVGSLIKTDKLFNEIFVVEARDLNEAIRVAAQVPQACTGSIDVRPLTPLETG